MYTGEHYPIWKLVQNFGVIAGMVRKFDKILTRMKKRTEFNLQKNVVTKFL